MKSSEQPQILSRQESASLRAAYLAAFIETQKDHYRRYIAKLHRFSDGMHYQGYLWDCLRKPERITVQKLRTLVNEIPSVLVMADNHSRDRVIGAPLWPYAPNSVVHFKSNVFLRALPVLPEDMYIFDYSILWTLVLTHEHDDHQRICCSVGIVPGPNTGCT